MSSQPSSDSQACSPTNHLLASAPLQPTISTAGTGSQETSIDGHYNDESKEDDQSQINKCVRESVFQESNSVLCKNSSRINDINANEYDDSGGNISNRNSATSITGYDAFHCQICLDFCPISDGFTFKCSHTFCRDCLTGYFRSKISDGEVVLQCCYIGEDSSNSNEHDVGTIQEDNLFVDSNSIDISLTDINTVSGVRKQLDEGELQVNGMKDNESEQRENSKNSDETGEAQKADEQVDLEALKVRNMRLPLVFKQEHTHEYTTDVSSVILEVGTSVGENEAGSTASTFPQTIATSMPANDTSKLIKQCGYTISSDEIVGLFLSSVNSRSKIANGSDKYDEVNALLKKFERFNFMKAHSNARECPNCSELQLGCVESPKMTCQKCSNIYCYTHSAAHDFNLQSCEEYEKSIAHEAKSSIDLIQATAKPCPGCGIQVMKSGKELSPSFINIFGYPLFRERYFWQGDATI